MREWAAGLMMAVALGLASRAWAEPTDVATATATPSTTPPGDMPGAARVEPPAAPSESYPLEAILRPIVLPRGLIAMRAFLSTHQLSQGFSAIRLFPTVGVGLGGGWDVSIIGPGVRWLDVPREFPEFFDQYGANPIQPVLAIDFEIYREVLQLVAGTRIELPIFAPRSFSGALDLRMQTCPLPWLGLSLGGRLRSFDPGDDDPASLLFGIDLPVALTAQLGQRVAITFRTGLSLDQNRSDPFLPEDAGPTVTVPADFEIEVALGAERTWGVIGATFALPTLIRSEPGELMSIVDETRYVLWVGLYL